MFSRVLSLIALAFSLVLSGCTMLQPKVEQVIVYRTRTIVISPNPAMLTTVSFIPPPDKQLYMMSKPRDREKLLVDIYLEQNKAIDQCNRSIVAIKDWVELESKKPVDDK